MDNRVPPSTFSIEDAQPSILFDTDISRINATTTVGRALSINTPRCVYATFSQDPTSQPVALSPDSDVSVEVERRSRASSPDRPGKPPKRRGDTVRFGSQQITHTFVPSPRAPSSPSANAAQWPCSMSLLDLHASCSADDFHDCDGGVSRRASNMSGRSGTFNECLAFAVLDADADSGAISRRASNMQDRSGTFNELFGDGPDDDEEEETDGNVSRRASNMAHCSGTFDQLIDAQEGKAYGGSAVHHSAAYSSAWADEGVYLGGGSVMAVSALRDLSESLLEERVSGANSRRASNMSTAAGTFDELVDEDEARASGAAGHVVSLAGGIFHAPSGGRMSTPVVQVPEPTSPPSDVEWSMRGYLGAGRNISADLAAASPGEDVSFAVAALGAPTPQPWAHGGGAPSDYPTPSPHRPSPLGSPNPAGTYPSDYMRMPQDVGPGPIADKQSRLAAIMSAAPSPASSPASESAIYTYEDCYRHLQRPTLQDSAMDRELERHFSQTAPPVQPADIWQSEASSSTLDMPGHNDECARHYLGMSARLSGSHCDEGLLRRELSTQSPTSSEYLKQLAAEQQDVRCSGDLGAAPAPIVPRSPPRLGGGPAGLSVRTSLQQPLAAGLSLEEQEILSHVKSILDIAHNLKVHTFPLSRAESPPQPRTAPAETLAHAVSLGHAASMDPALFKAPSALFCRTPRESYAVFASDRLEPSLSKLPRQLSCKTPKQVFAVFAPPENVGMAVKRQASPGNLNERRDAQPQRIQSPQPKPFASRQLVATGKGALAQHAAAAIPAGHSHNEIKHFTE